MMIRTTATIVLLLALAACDREPDWETRTYRLRHIQPERAEELVRPYVLTLADASVSTVGGDTPAITVRHTPAMLDRIAELLTDFDRPSPMVQLRFRIVEANGFASDTLIRDVEPTLRSLFRFGGYRQVAEAVATVGAWGSVMQQLSGGGQRFRLAANVGEVLVDDSTGSVQVDVELRSSQAGSPLLLTEVTVPIGRTVVLGTSKPGPEAGAYILTVEPSLTSSRR